MKILKIKSDLLHISFNKHLEGMWKPRLPDGYSSKKTDLTEPDYPRISVAPTVEQCFWAIYPNISQYFEKEKFPYLEFMVYQPEITDDTEIMSNIDVVKKRLVHDAHITEESFILNKTKMVRHSVVRIKNCTKNKEIWYYPFNDKKFEKRFLSHEIQFSTIESF